ncbi:MAG: hypothetical protein U1F81_18205 [Verrucomicrobiaceae bacterium]
MSQQIDLNLLRDTILSNQRQGLVNPTEPNKVVLVSREGQLSLGQQVSAEDQRNLSKVTQDTFHGRRENEQVIATTKMPRNTQKITTSENVEGWLYSFRCELGRDFKMFAYFDGSYYQVIVIEPVVESKYQSAHTGHIFSTGKICFGAGYNSGRPTLEEAYSKSVLWANGFSAMMDSGLATFPFSINNL